MKKIIPACGMALLLAACSPGPGEKKENSGGTDTVALSDNKEPEKKYADPNLPPSPDYTGDHVVKYKTGITRFRGFFRFGKKHGKWAAFFPGGELQSETEYDNGKRNGKITVWYPNGQVMYEGEFKNDQRSGTWRTYDEAGKLLEEKKY